MEINKILRIVFILTAVAFFLTYSSSNKTDCESCKIEYDGKIIDGYEAFEIFEDACISYDAPWTVREPIPDNFADNVTVVGVIE